MIKINDDVKDFLEDLIRNEVIGVDTKTAQALLESLDNALYYEEVIEQDIKTTLKEHYGYGQHSIEQFWQLEGASICDEAYTAITEVLATKEANYNIIIGDIEL